MTFCGAAGAAVAAGRSGAGDRLCRRPAHWLPGSLIAKSRRAGNAQQHQGTRRDVDQAAREDHDVGRAGAEKEAPQHDLHLRQARIAFARADRSASTATGQAPCDAPPRNRAGQLRAQRRTTSVTNDGVPDAGDADLEDQRSSGVAFAPCRRITFTSATGTIMPLSNCAGLGGIGRQTMIVHQSIEPRQVRPVSDSDTVTR